MVDYSLRDLFLQNSVKKQLFIETDDKTVKITNAELHSQQFELTESLCSENRLKFGCCEASVVKFKISNVFTSMVGKWITITMVLDGNTDNPFTIGRYKVYSDVPTADRRYRDITAYDAMYDILNADVTDWYKNLFLADNTAVSMEIFRRSFAEYVGIEMEDVELINDSMIVSKTIEPSGITGKDVLTAICEINGCFGHINRQGKLTFVYLPTKIQGLYPSDTLYPSNDLYPVEPNSQRIKKSHYMSCKYEDFTTKEIDKIQIRKEENDIGVVVGNGTNCYIIEDNFLVYGMSTEELQPIAQNILDKVRYIMYRPFSAECIGDLCLEVGDSVRLSTKYAIVESYILKRTIKGIRSLRDTYSSNGRESYENKGNSIAKSIVQLKAKTNLLERTLEETKSTITDTEEGLQSQITQNAKEISSEVTRAKSAEITLRSSITQNANSIKLRVEKGNVSSELSLEEDLVSIKGNRLEVESDNFSLDTEGNVSIRGDITCDDKISMYSSWNQQFFPLVEVIHDEAENVGISFKNVYGVEFMSINEGSGYLFHGDITGIADRSNVSNQVKCSDNITKIGIGTLVNDNFNSVAQILSKPQNSDGNYLITVKGLWGAETYTNHNIVSSSSDKRLKTDIEDCKVDALKLIDSIRVREFKWKSDNSEQKIGFIADELEQLDPRLSVGGGTEEDGTPNYKSVDGYYLQGYEVKAIQELHKQNTELKLEIEALKANVSFLMERIGEQHE